MYKMGKKEIVLDPNTAAFDADNNAIYSVGRYKIKLFSSLEDKISEQNCLRLSQVKTKRIILPQYPVYHDETYCGCAYRKLEDDDWIDSFFGKAEYLKESIQFMKEDIFTLSNLGIDMVKMLSFLSSGNFKALYYYGTDYVQESQVHNHETLKKNLRLFHEYLNNLVYNGMSEFGIDPNLVEQYLRHAAPITTTLESALTGEGYAGELISRDIKQKVLK